MKIGPLETKSTLATSGGERKVASGATGAAPAAEPSAKVELSAAASLLANAASDGTFDAQKVERLAQAIRDGVFQVDANAIADKLLANARELLGKAPK